MSVDVLDNSNIVHVLDNTDTAASVPAGQYKASALAEWSVSDPSGNDYTIPAGESVQTFATGLSKINYGQAPLPTSWGKGSIANNGLLKSPLGLVWDGSTWVAGNASGKFISSNDGKTWSDYANLNGYATEDDAPRVVSSQFWSKPSGSSSVTIQLSQTPQAGDVILFAAFGYKDSFWYQSTSSMSNPSGFDTIYRYDDQSTVSMTLAKKISDGTETSIGSSGNTYRHSGYVLVVRGAKNSTQLGANITTSTGYDVDSVTAKPNSLVLLVGGSDQPYSGTITAPATYTLGGTQTNDNVFAFWARKYWPVSQEQGTENPGAFSFSSPSNPGGTGGLFILSFEPVNAPIPINCFTYGNAGFIAYNPLAGKFGIGNNPLTAWDFNTPTLSVDSSAYPTYVSRTTRGGQTNNGTRMSLPAGARVGDTVVMVSHAWYSPNTSFMTADGFSILFNESYGSISTSIYVKTLTSIPADLPTVPSYNNDGNFSTVNIALLFRTVGEIKAFGEVYSDSTIFDAAARTVTAGTLNHVIFGHREYDSSLQATPAGYTEIATEQGTNTNRMESWIFQKAITTAGSEDPGQIISGTSSRNGMLVSLQVSPPSKPSLKAADFLNGAYYAYGDSFVRSTNGTAWTVYVKPFGGRINKMIFANGRILAVGNGGGIASSANGISWTIHSSGTTENIVDVGFSNGAYFAYTSTGTGLSSSNGTSWTLAVAASSGAAAPTHLWTKVYGGARGFFERSYSFDNSVNEGDLVIASFGFETTTTYHNVEILEKGWTPLNFNYMDNDNISSQYRSMTWYKFMTNEPDHSVTFRYVRDLRFNTTDVSFTNNNGSVALIAFRGIDKKQHIEALSEGNNTSVYRPALTSNSPHRYVTILHTSSMNNQPSLTPNNATNTANWSGLGFNNLQFANNSQGSVIVAMRDMPNGGTTNSYTWFDANNNVVVSTVMSTIAIAIPTASAISSAGAQPSVIGEASVFPYFIGAYDNGQSIVTNSITGARTAITTAPFPGDGFVFASNAGGRAIAITSGGNLAYLGNASEKLALTPIGGVRNASS